MRGTQKNVVRLALIGPEFADMKLASPYNILHHARALQHDQHL